MTTIRRTKSLVQIGMHSVLCCEHGDCNQWADVKIVDGVPFCPAHVPAPADPGRKARS